jgi:hypothetical protein
LKVLAKDYVLDKHGLDLDTPSRSSVFNDLADRLSDLLTTLDHILKNTGTNDVAKCGLCALNECLTNVADAEGCFVRGRNAVVDDGRQLQRYVILGHADLLRNFDDLDLDIDLDKLLRQRVHVDKTWVDSAGETTELGDQTDVSLIDRFVRIGADEAAWNGAGCTDAAAKGVDLDTC